MKQAISSVLEPLFYRAERDGFFSDEKIVGIIKKIKEIYPDCAVTLSDRERTHDSYKSFLLPEQTDICFGTKRLIRSITDGFIQAIFRLKTECNAFMI